MKNKRILSFFLTIVLLFSLLMPQAYAASDILSGRSRLRRHCW